MSNAYLRQRNKIARAHNAREIKHLADWDTHDFCVSTDLRSDSGGLLLLEKFEQKLAKINGPAAFADDGESIAIWEGTRAEITKGCKKYQEAQKRKASRYVLFHPGYLPVRVPPVEWRSLRVENPNSTPYYHLRGIKWLWTIYYDSAKVRCEVQSYRFEEKIAGPGDPLWIVAKIEHGKHYALPSPYIRTQGQMDRLLGLAAEFRRKLEIVSARYKVADRTQDGDKLRKQLWFGIE